MPEGLLRNFLAEDLIEPCVAPLNGEDGPQNVKGSHHLIGWGLRPEKGAELVPRLDARIRHALPVGLQGEGVGVPQPE